MILLSFGHAKAATGATPEAIPDDGKMRWLLGQAYKNPKELRDPDLPRTPPERMILYLRQQWTDQDHEVMQADRPLDANRIRAGVPYCLGMVRRDSKTASNMLFSPTALALPMHLIVRDTALAELARNPAGEVDLEQLIRHGKLHGAFFSDSSYGSVVDALLQAENSKKGAKHVSLFAPIGYGTRVLTMLQHGRADYTLAPEWILEVPGAGDRSAEGLVAVPIQGMNELVPVGIACPRTTWGQAAITRIDQILSTPEGAAMLKQTYQTWYSPERLRQYERQLDEFYRKRARGGALP